ncbi:glycosyltransferase [Enterococcus sp. LJL51]|uniref:glycosyltransferase n=1 Tax=Enterococcus sp. LJL51 TaxID=3416656 RepID=UPI003CE9B135
MMGYKVLVIMSTYNGENYLSEQLNSIFNQSGVDVSVWVRDDGSQDRTMEILEESSKKNSLRFYKDGSNLGPARSFLKALKDSGNDYDFYAYADQDDIWFPEKMKNACEKLSTYPVDQPNLYCSTYDVVDNNLNVLFKREMHAHIPLTLEATIIDRSPSGCTMLFNKTLRDILCTSNPKSIRMHDYWTLLTTEALNGNIYFDENSTMLYRQHEYNNVGYTNKNVFKRIRRLVKSAVKQKNERQQQAISVYECYKERIESEKLAELKKVVFYRDSLKNRFRLVKSKNFVTDTHLNTWLFKFSVILGIF